MNSFKRIAWLLSICFSTSSLAEEVRPENFGTEELTAMLEDIDARFEQLVSMQYEVVKTSKGQREESKEQYSFKYMRPSFFRAEYKAPNPRLIVLDEEYLTEYLPEVRKALKTPLSSMKGAALRDFIGGIFARVSVEGLRVGEVSTLLSRLDSVTASKNNPKGWVLIGSNPKYKIELDTEKQVVTHTEIWNSDGDLRVRTKSSEFIEVIPDFWFPQRIDAAYPKADGFINVLYTLANIRLNGAIDADSFKFKKPRGVEILSP